METPVETEPRATPAAPRLARESGPRLAELAEDLIWPRLLHAVGLALRPSRIGLALFTLVLIRLLGMIPTLWDGPDPVLAAWDGARDGTAALLGGEVGAAAERSVMFLPAMLRDPHMILATLVAGVPALVVFVLGGGAIARSAAVDFAHHVALPWPRALGFAVARWGALVGAVLGPLLLVVLILLALAVGGLLLLVPVLDVVAAVLYALALAAAVVGVVVMLAYALGWPLLVAAVACEGTDGFHAVERAYAYVLGRPLRLILYALTLLVLGLVVVGLALFIAAGAAELAQVGVSWFAGERARAIADPLGTPGLEGTAGVAARIVGFWIGLLGLLAAAYGVSYFFCAATMLYLAMRRACDGQDMAEVWMPGMIEGTMAEAMAGRAKAATEAGKMPDQVRPLAEGGGA